MTTDSDNQEKFAIAEAAAITGVSSDHIRQWMERGWVKASILQTKEMDGKDVFNRVDIYNIAYLKKIMESGFSRKLAQEKINIYAVNETVTNFPQIKSLGIAFSRVMDNGEYKAQGAWLVAPELDQETGWDSLALIGERLNQGADDFYLLNFLKLKHRIDSIITEMKV